MLIKTDGATANICSLSSFKKENKCILENERKKLHCQTDTSQCSIFVRMCLFTVCNFYFRDTTWKARALICADAGRVTSAWWIAVLLHWLTGYHPGSLSGCVLIMGPVMDHYLVMLQEHYWQIKTTNTLNQLWYVLWFCIMLMYFWCNVTNSLLTI